MTDDGFRFASFVLLYLFTFGVRRPLIAVDHRQKSYADRIITVIVNLSRRLMSIMLM